VKSVDEKVGTRCASQQTCKDGKKKRTAARGHFIRSTRRGSESDSGPRFPGLRDRTAALASHAQHLRAGRRSLVGSARSIGAGAFRTKIRAGKADAEVRGSIPHSKSPSRAGFVQVTASSNAHGCFVGDNSVYSTDDAIALVGCCSSLLRKLERKLHFWSNFKFSSARTLYPLLNESALR